MSILVQPREYLKVYQYQIEFEGGQRYGPAWLHRKDAEKYLKELYKRKDAALEGQEPRIVKFWVRDLKQKFRNLKPELVK